MQKALPRIRKFHGHIGPYVLLGYRIGELSRNVIKNIRSIKIYVHDKPPQSCIIDGIQLSTGCTIGNGKIKIINSRAKTKVLVFGNNSKIEITLSNFIKQSLKKSLKLSIPIIKKANINNLLGIKN
ncbi:formylmethanofuran dehydrogenase subunit E family protein [Patescibacteria group bacterium]|nr:formylmethanofuran dehydrogenase subunit E family protein [Patescibacteria group bacterium]MBU0964647.1 formylmethanofuran dehydrogenase subunit E family protein [Patescibacteria group bacterium]